MAATPKVPGRCYVRLLIMVDPLPRLRAAPAPENLSQDASVPQYKLAHLVRLFLDLLKPNKLGRGGSQRSRECRGFSSFAAAMLFISSIAALAVPTKKVMQPKLSGEETIPVDVERKTFIWRDLKWSIPTSFFSMPFEESSRFLELRAWWTPGFFQTRGPSVGSAYVRILIDDQQHFDPFRYIKLKSGDMDVVARVEHTIGVGPSYLGSWGSTHYFNFPSWKRGPRPLLLTCRHLPSLEGMSASPLCRLYVLTIQGLIAEVTVPTNVHRDVTRLASDILLLMETFTQQKNSPRSN